MRHTRLFHVRPFVMLAAVLAARGAAVARAAEPASTAAAGDVAGWSMRAPRDEIRPLFRVRA